MDGTAESVRYLDDDLDGILDALARITYRRRQIVETEGTTSSAAGSSLQRPPQKSPNTSPVTKRC
jgi:predicted transcriptional regulator